MLFRTSGDPRDHSAIIMVTILCNTTIPYSTQMLYVIVEMRSIQPQSLASRGKKIFSLGIIYRVCCRRCFHLSCLLYEIFGRMVKPAFTRCVQPWFVSVIRGRH